MTSAVLAAAEVRARGETSRDRKLLSRIPLAQLRA